MRRAILSLTGMVAGTTLLISLKSAPGASRLPEQVAADLAAAAKAAALASASAAPSTGPSAEPVDRPALPTPGTTMAPAPGPSNNPAPGPGPTTRPPVVSPPKPKVTTKPPNPLANQGTFTGDSAFTEFGYVTVAITVAGGKIAQVTKVEMPENEPRSKRISDEAEPVLRQQALAAQSSKIDSVSGATYTSEAYRTSLQSAIDKAGLG